MTSCFFVSDLHGSTDRYTKLFRLISIEKPALVFFGGDLLPHAFKKIPEVDDFTEDFLFRELKILKTSLNQTYPEMFIILGNDDARCEEEKFIRESNQGLFHYINQRKIVYKDYSIFGYSFIPPTPFQNKDWEKYDVSRYVDPGCIHPTEGFRTTKTNEDIEFATIKNDLEILTKNEDLSKSIFLFHSPPYQTLLDRAALDGKMIEHVPLDLNIGSISIKRFIEEKHPTITLHGHVHESSRLTGYWKQKIENTIAFSAAYEKPKLSVIKFKLENPEKAERILL
jgi:Icc-related predicted phosphoesterase